MTKIRQPMQTTEDVPESAIGEGFASALLYAARN